MTELDLEAILAGINDPLPEGHRSGVVCLAGRPNVGKSTLLNAMVGTKVSIVTPVPGTTRNAIRGIVTREDAQIVFIDTPGMAKPHNLLNRRLNELVRRTFETVDVVCFVVDADAGIGQGDRFIAQQLAQAHVPVVCVVNKEDAAGRQRMPPILLQAAALGADWEVVPIAALTGYNVQYLTDLLVARLPQGPRLFPTGMASDQPERQLIGEVLREKFLTRVFDEVPHSIAVEVDELEDDEEGLVRIFATIFVERDSQKGIVIGKGGQVLKEGNTQARVELEGLLAVKVFLDVRVKVAKEWQRDPRSLARFGY